MLKIMRYCLLQTTMLPNYRLVKFNLSKPAKENWQDVLPNKDYVLEHAEIINQQIVAQYLKDVTSLVEFYSMTGEKLGELKQPGLGIVTGISGKKDEDFMYYGFTSYIYPHTIFKYNKDGDDEVYYKPEIDFNPDDYVSEQVFYKSKDGTKVPMFITHKKGIKMDGTNPTMLYGYGGFQISIKPSYSTVNTVFLENGGIYTVANMRGGNEYGEEWHKGGMLHNKQNVFDDFIAAAEYLVEKKFTSHEKLAIYGRSNGGLLIGAVMTQRPDIAKVALPTVGVLDMLRYHKFTVGWGWVVEYGSSDEKEHFENLIKYSPLHNVKEGVNYPATMVITGDHDDRVVPAHSFKFAATLQDKYKGNEPMLIRIDVNAGHGSGKPTAKIIDEWTDMWSFTMWNLGIKEVNK
jgi:prolyl oligopeptidase